jgi:hypothetical protein
MSIRQISDLYDAYLKGWDAALQNAAMSFEGSERSAILSLLKRAKEYERAQESPPFPCPSGSSFL